MAELYDNLHLQLLGGIWREGGSDRILPDVNPYTGNRLLNIKMANAEDLDQAYQIARDIQHDWASRTPAQRAEVMLRAVDIFDKRRDEIINWLISESGSTRIKAGLEWKAARDITLESASFPARVHGRLSGSNIPGKENLIYREPLGVVGIISPWNFPLHLTPRSLAPALALGNGVVLKPASDTPITGGLLLAKIFEEAGLPNGLLSVVVGPGNQIGDLFVSHSVPSLISFTGSSAVGARIGALACGGEHLKKVALELGGNTPFVVLADANLEQAVDAAVFGKFFHQGQICMAVNRIIVEDPVYDEFVVRFVKRVRELKVGDPALKETAIGPVINRQQCDGLLEKIRRAKDEGARVMLAGKVQDLMVPPHIFVDVSPDAELARGEIFGPLVGIIRAADEAQALTLANHSEYGLSSAIFSRDISRAMRFARKLNAGMTHINDIPVNDEPHVAFGGEKNSGIGRFNGEWAIEEFTRDHWISVQNTPRPYPF